MIKENIMQQCINISYPTEQHSEIIENMLWNTETDPIALPT